LAGRRDLNKKGRAKPKLEKSRGADNASDTGYKYIYYCAPKNRMAEQAPQPSDTDEGLYEPGSLFALHTRKKTRQQGPPQTATEESDKDWGADHDMPAIGGDLSSGRAAEGRRRGGEQTRGSALEGLTTTETECAEGVCVGRGAPCSSKPVLAAIAAFSQHVSGSTEGSGPGPARATPPIGRQDGSGGSGPLPGGAVPEASAVRKAAAAVGCGSESCLLAHPHFVSYAENVFGLESERLRREKNLRFKAAGPRTGHALLNNYNIDETLQRWARVFTSFFPYPFAMMDFDRTGEPFATIDPVAVLAGQVPADLGPGLEKVLRPCQTLGCVVNTDVSTGKGKHWVAVFVDCRGPGRWAVEYFNSAGRPPPKAMTHWMERTRARLAAARKSIGSGKTDGGDSADGAVITNAVTDVAHQESQTECGLYALFYIRRRLEGTPAAYFEDPTQIITDDEMTEFRKHCFRAAT
jgi:hypothetical protein